jgi:hypothetical protein
MALSQFIKACSRHTPGIKEIWLGIATGFVSGVIGTNIVTLVSNAQVLWSLPQDSVKITQTPTGSKNGLFYVEKTIEIQWNKIENSSLIPLRDLADSSACGITVMYQTNNNEWFCSGFEKASDTALSADRGLFFETGEMTSGMELTEDDSDIAKATLKGTFPEFDFSMNTVAHTVGAAGLTAD